MTTPVRIVQVGLGLWGVDWARRVVPDVRTVETVAWVDPAPEARTRAVDKLGLPAERCFASLSEAVRVATPEAVLGTVALAAHAPVITEALDEGLHILIEKPFAPSADEAQALADAAARAGRILHVSQNYRFYPAVTKTRELLQQSRLGDVIAADIEFNRYMPEHRYLTIKDPLLADMMIHQFDMIRFVLGAEPQEVVCWSWNPPGSPFTHDASAAAMIRMADGAVVTLRGSWLSREAQTKWAGRWRIQCADGLIRFESRAGADTDVAGDRVALRRLGADGDEDVPLDPLPLFGRTGTLDAFARTVRSETTDGWAAEAAHNVGSLRLMEAAIGSAANGGAVTRIA